MTFDDLHISVPAIYAQMGYKDSVPDADILKEMVATLKEIKTILRPQYNFFIADGSLNIEDSTLTVTSLQTAEPMTVTFDVGKIIARQLRETEAYALFVATAGMEFESYLHRLKADGDMVRLFIADSVGSVIAECAADEMEKALQKQIDGRGWKRTNRFSPGYCGWHVSQQQLLFPLFGEAEPCGVTLSSSSLMTPIKSVSGVIGLGRDARYMDYSCGLCDYKQCYKRKQLSPSGVKSKE